MHAVVYRAMDGGLYHVPERVVEVARFRTGAGHRQGRILAEEVREPGTQGRVVVTGIDQMGDGAGVHQARQGRHAGLGMAHTIARELRHAPRLVRQNDF